MDCQNYSKRFRSFRICQLDIIIRLSFSTDLAIQVKETSVLGAFHPDARDLFNTCSDLKRVAWELWNPERSLKDTVSELR